MDNKILLGQLLSSVRSEIAKRNEGDLAVAEVAVGAEQKLEPELEKANLEVKIMDEKDIQALQEDLGAKKAELESTVAELDKTKEEIQAQASQMESLTTEMTQIKDELEGLRKFKQEAEEAQKRVELLTDRKAKVEQAGLTLDIEADADKWLGMSDEVFDFTITQMSEILKGASASASVNVPNITSNQEDESDAKSIVKEGLKEHKNQ